MDIDDNIHRPNFSQILDKYRIVFALGGLGLILLVVGIRLITNQESKVEFIEESTASAVISNQIKADISGAVISPGVYSLNSESRLQDLLLSAGGLASDADRDWVDKYINLAARVVDGSKLYIPKTGEYENKNTVLGTNSDISGTEMININLATSSELDKLPGVGEATSAKIIENRPYSTTEELLNKKIINQATFEKIKDKISVY